MDVTQSLKQAENSLRDFIAYILQKESGDDWIEKCGVTEDRISIWKDRKKTESEKHNEALLESRLIYYADFYDLKTILKKNWSGEFSNAFGKWKTMEVFLNELEKYRNPEAHRRDILTYQKHLIIGISGEIRNKIVTYRSMKEEKTSEDFYPRLERVSDNFGNVWTPDFGHRSISTDCKLRVGDEILFNVSATDPLGENILYSLKQFAGKVEKKWGKENEILLTIQKEHVGKHLYLMIRIKSEREFHAHGDYDDSAQFTYEVLPPTVK